MPHCFKMPQTPKTRAHNGSELRFATVLAIICRPTLRRFAPSLRAQFSFFYATRGSAASPLHRRALLKFSGILLLFDVQSSTTEKEQKDRHLLFLRRGGARTPGWDYTRKIVRDPSLPVFQRLRVLSRIVDRNISILRTSEIENETELQYHNSV